MHTYMHLHVCLCTDDKGSYSEYKENYKSLRKILFIKNLFYFMYITSCLLVSMCANACDVPGSQKKVSEPLELELQKVLSHHVDTYTWHTDIHRKTLIHIK